MSYGKKNIGCTWYIIMTIGIMFGLCCIFSYFAPNTAKNIRNGAIEYVFGVSIEKNDTVTNDSVVVLPKIEVKKDTIVDEYTTIPIEIEGNVTHIIAKLNGGDVRFILDTGCSDIQITTVEFLYLKHMGYVSDEDLGEVVKCTYANGGEGECHSLNIKTLTIGDIDMNDVNCTVEENVDAPRLLGQSVLQRLGEVSIDYKNKVIKIKK